MIVTYESNCTSNSSKVEGYAARPPLTIIGRRGSCCRHDMIPWLVDLGYYDKILFSGIFLLNRNINRILVYLLLWQQTLALSSANNVQHIIRLDAKLLFCGEERILI